MKRREFIQSGCYTGLALVAGSCFLLDGCKTTSFKEVGDEAIIPLSEFKKKNILVFNSKKLLQNVIVNKESDQSYKAFLMKCTHKGASLELIDNDLVCPSHGSVFDLQGNVKSAPAQKPLKSFPVTIKASEILIVLS